MYEKSLLSHITYKDVSCRLSFDGKLRSSTSNAEVSCVLVPLSHSHMLRIQLFCLLRCLDHRLYCSVVSVWVWVSAGECSCACGTRDGQRL